MGEKVIFSTLLGQPKLHEILSFQIIIMLSFSTTFWDNLNHAHRNFPDESVLNSVVLQEVPVKSVKNNLRSLLNFGILCVASIDYGTPRSKLLADKEKKDDG